MDSTLHNSWSYTRDGCSRGLSVSLWVEAANGLSSWGSLFKPLGTIHVRVLFWEALDAFMFVVAWCGVTRVVVSSSWSIHPAFVFVISDKGLWCPHWLGACLSCAGTESCLKELQLIQPGQCLSGAPREALAKKWGVNSWLVLVKCGFSFLVVVGIVVGFEYYVGTRVMLLSSEAMMAIYVTKQLADCRNE